MTLGVRPNDVHVVPSGKAPPNALSARVEMTEYLGIETLVEPADPDRLASADASL